MNRTVIVMMLFAAVVAPVGADQVRTLVRLDGWIVDSYCRAKNANPEGAQDTLECLKKGAKLILIARDGTSYALENQELAAKHLGKEVHVFGMVDGERNLRVGNYISDEALGGSVDPSGEPQDTGFVHRKVDPDEKSGKPDEAKPEKKKDES
jgi:hypothetical protein